MARLPEVFRRSAVSQVAPERPIPGQGWRALAEAMSAAAEFTQPAAEQEAREQGLQAVQRGPDGKLTVDTKSPYGGRMAQIHNSAALAKFEAQRGIDITQNLTELAETHRYDPEGFREASDAYIAALQAEEGIPALIRDDIVIGAQSEAQRRFNGLYSQQVSRDYRDSDKSTKAQLDMWADDYISLYMSGDLEGAEAKLEEMQGIVDFRSAAPYINDTAETGEAYMRGIRGSAKAARLSRQLADLEGQTEIPDELRSEIDATLEDPDLNPRARATLYAATQGRFKQIDAAAFVEGITASDYESKVVRVESAGKANAKNPNSSATGHHQFTAGTWLDNVAEVRAKGGAKWADGLSKNQLLEMRENGDASSEIFAHFRQANAAHLSANGLPVTDATEYMAHFFGKGGAVTVLQADPTKKLSDILPKSVIDANPFLANMTAHDAHQWAARKMTVKASDIARTRVQVDQIEDRELRSMAASMVSDAYQVRRRVEQAAEMEIEERVQANDPSLTEQQILENNELSDSAQAALVSDLRKVREDQLVVQDTVAALNDESSSFNVYDNQTRKGLDKTFDVLTQDADEIQTQLTAGEIAARSGYLPKQAFSTARSALSGTDPAAFAAQAELLQQVLSRQPGAISAHDGRKGVQDRLADYEFFSRFMGSEDAAARVIEANSPEAQASRKNLSDAAKQAVKQIEAKDIEAHFADNGVDVSLGSDTQQAEIMGEYERLFTDAFLSTGDVEMAKNRALTEMSRVYGPNEITGSSRLMKYPPQSFYPASLTNPDWMREQISQDVSDYVFGDDITPLMEGLTGMFVEGNLAMAGTMNRISPDNIQILSDMQTRKEVAAGQAPSYQVYFTNDDGMFEAVPGRYRFEPPQGDQEADRERLETQRATESERANVRAWRSILRKEHGGPKGDQMLQTDLEFYKSFPPPKEE